MRCVAPDVKMSFVESGAPPHDRHALLGDACSPVGAFRHCLTHAEPSSVAAAAMMGAVDDGGGARSAPGTTGQSSGRLRSIESETARWVDAGLITAEQASAVVEFERRSATGRSPVVAEVLAYLGAALVVAAVVTLVASRWSDLVLGPKLVLLGVAAAVGVVGGAVARTRSGGAFDRVTTVLWFASLGAVGGFVAVAAGIEGLDWSEDAVPVAVAGTVTAAALGLYLFHRRGPQLLALTGSSTAFVALLLQLAGVEYAPAYGSVLILAGAMWLLQSLVPLLRPAPVAFVAGGVIAYIGSAVMSDEWVIAGLTIGVAGAVAIVVLSLRTRDLVHLFTGAVGLFVTLPRFAVELIGESIGAPLALLVVGVLVIAVSVLAGRLHGHPEADRDPSAAP